MFNLFVLHDVLLNGKMSGECFSHKKCHPKLILCPHTHSKYSSSVQVQSCWLPVTMQNRAEQYIGIILIMWHVTKYHLGSLQYFLNVDTEVFGLKYYDNCFVYIIRPDKQPCH